MSFYNDKRKKVRGQRRRLKSLLSNIDKFIPFKKLDGLYEHFHVPCSPFIEREKTSNKIKLEFCKKWITTAERFIMTNHDNIPFCKVVAIIDISHLWSSQIVIFYDEKYYSTFWDRNDIYQKWVPISDTKNSFLKRSQISTTLSERGFYEIIHDDDFSYKGELWFYEAS